MKSTCTGSFVLENFLSEVPFTINIVVIIINLIATIIAAATSVTLFNLWLLAFIVMIMLIISKGLS